MPIMEFGTLGSFKDWISNFAKSDRYMFCVTSENEIIAQPLKTSRPIIYGYMKITDEKELGGLIKKLRENGYSVVQLKSFSWDTDRQPGQKRVFE